MTRGPNHPKIQHYVPQFLLKQFGSDKKNQIFVFDKLNERSFPSAIRKVASEKSFYDFELNGVEFSYEQFFSNMESDASTRIKSIVTNNSIAHLSDSDKLVISSFAALQQLRVRATRDKHKSFIRNFQKEIQNRGFITEGEFPDDEEIKMQSLVNLESAKKNVEFFYNKSWVLLEAPLKSSFYISDNPITLNKTLREESELGIGLKTRAIA